jgi:hypothetical protein
MYQKMNLHCNQPNAVRNEAPHLMTEDIIINSMFKAIRHLSNGGMMIRRGKQKTLKQREREPGSSDTLSIMNLT